MNTNFFNELKSIAKRNEETFEYNGKEITVREMSGDMRDFYDADAHKRVHFKGRHPDFNSLNMKGQRALVVAMTLVDRSTDELAFDYMNSEDLKAIGELSADFLNKVYDVAMKLCGLSAEAEEELEGN